MSRYFVAHTRWRARRSNDVILLTVGLLLAGWAWTQADRVSSFEQTLGDLVGVLPSWFAALYVVGYIVGGLYVVGLVVASALGGPNRRDVLRDIVLALVAALGCAVLLGVTSGDLSNLLPELGRSETEPSFPVVRVALVASAIVASAPSLTRPMRRFGWSITVLVALSGLGLRLGMASDVLGGVGIGLAAGSAILLIFGSPRGYPDVVAVSAALREFGLDVDDLAVPAEQSWGVRRLRGMLVSGERVEVKAYGRDATDSQWLTRLWHTLWYRDTGRVFSMSRREGVEHEALMLLLAARQGVSVESVLGVGVGGDDVALLVTSRSDDWPLIGSPDHRLLVAAFQEMDALHDAGLAHGKLTLGSFRTGDVGPVLADFDAASLTTDRVAKDLDVVSLLFEMAATAGPQQAVSAARTVLDDATLNRVVSFLQVPALSSEQRRRFPKPKQTLDELRDLILEATGAEAIEPAKLRRVSPKDLVMPGLSLVAAYALIGMLSGIDFAEVWAVVQDAEWLWILVGFIVGQFVFLPQATGMLFAVGYPLPLEPLTVLQVSVNWIGLAVPSAAGRVAMNSVFLRKYGVAPTVAVAQGAIDGVAGFIVEVSTLAVAVLAYDDLEVDLGSADLRWGLILLLAVVLVGVGVLVVLRIERLRNLIVPVILDGARLLWSVVKDPKRALGLLGSNLASRLVLAVVLWFTLQAIDSPLPLLTCLVVSVATNLLAGLVPIPGGIGVAEAVMTSFLVVMGVPPEEAFAAAVVFRIATFYVPAGEGFFAMRWLETRGYI